MSKYFRYLEYSLVLKLISCVLFCSLNVTAGDFKITYVACICGPHSISLGQDSYRWLSNYSWEPYPPSDA